LTALRRTRVGRFRIAQAHTLDDLLSRVEAGEPLPLLGLAEAAQAAFPFREVTAEEAEDLAHGRRVARIASDGTPGEANPIALIGPGIVALAVDDGDSLRPTAVLTDPTAR
jgi:tRNA pseudouridine55 synthase